VSDPAPIPHMTADEFITWAMSQPEGERYELAGGEVIAMAPERVSHARAKLHITRRLIAAIEAAGVDCEAFVDGLAVVVDASTVYEPDAMVRCGTSLDGATVRISDPIIVVEVLSPATRGRDTGAKLADYFRLASVRHYLIVRAEDRVIIHHRRSDDRSIMTRILHDGPIRLDPPGIILSEPFAPAT
jgi:Uma2 family endonuclease